MKELEKLREILLTEVDEETRQENEEQIRRWEEELQQHEGLASWQSHDVSKLIADKARKAYLDASMILATRRDHPEDFRVQMWAKQDAAMWLLSILTGDAKGQIERLQRDIRNALNATK